MRPLVADVRKWPNHDFIAGWAKKSGLARATVRRAILRGALPAEKVCGHYVISKNDFLSWGNKSRYEKTS